MEKDFYSNSMEALSIVEKVLNRLLRFRFPSSTPVGFYLALMSVLQEIEEVRSYLKNMEL